MHVKNKRCLFRPSLHMYMPPLHTFRLMRQCLGPRKREQDNNRAWWARGGTRGFGAGEGLSARHDGRSDRLNLGFEFRLDPVPRKQPMPPRSPAKGRANPNSYPAAHCINAWPALGYHPTIESSVLSWL